MMHVKRDLDVNTQLSVYRLSDYPDSIPVYFVATRRCCRVCAFLSGLHFPRSPLTNPHNTTSPTPSSTTLSHTSLFALALHSLTPQTRLSTHFTPASSSLPPLPGYVHGELTVSPPLSLRASQATTRRYFGAPSSLMSQHDRVNTLLLPLVVSYCSYLPRLARFASIDDNWWWPDESARVA